METDCGRIKLVIQSKKVLVRVEDYVHPVVTPGGNVVHNKRGQLRVYDYVLDEGQRRAIADARELARRSGMILEVTDLSRQSFVRRALNSGLGIIGGRGGRPR